MKTSDEITEIAMQIQRILVLNDLNVAEAAIVLAALAKGYSNHQPQFAVQFYKLIKELNLNTLPS